MTHVHKSKTQGGLAHLANVLYPFVIILLNAFLKSVNHKVLLNLYATDKLNV